MRPVILSRLIQGCSANKKGVGMHPKIAIFNRYQLLLEQNVKNVWERRSHAFPPHYTRGFLTPVVN